METLDDQLAGEAAVYTEYLQLENSSSVEPIEAMAKKELASLEKSKWALNYTYDSLVKKVDNMAMLLDTTVVKFEDIEKVTTKAILFSIANINDGSIAELWIPKGVCSNMDYLNKEVGVWNTFLVENDKLKGYYHEIYTK